MATTILKFATFISDIELPFYTSLASHKINHDKLDDSARRLLGLYEIRPTDQPDASCRLQVHGNSLTVDEVPAGFCRAEGMIKNVNTIEEYRSLDKGAILNQSGRTIWDAINDGTIYSCPSLLASFTVICFADLKKYKFTYQFAFPVLHSGHTWRLESASTPHASGNDVSENIENSIRLTSLESTALVDAVQTWRYSVDERQYGFFLAKKQRLVRRMSGNAIECKVAEFGDGRPNTPEISGKRFKWVIGSLASYDNGFFDGVNSDDRYVCFVDPSTYPTYPGWMLRNLLVLIRRRWQLRKVQVLCYRDTHPRRDDALSIILRLEASDSPEQGATTHTAEPVPPQMPKVTGWERNAAGKVMSKVANLGEYMDPKRLADQAVDLNLKLIKWRIAPELDLDSVKETKCLLLGAGTLGSYVARNLLGWGVRKITFVDNGSVSFSNPVRQPLFNFQDCLAGGVKKAIRASEALKEIYPGADSGGYVISVPMVGHPIIDESKSKSEFDTLKRLIDEHDAIFLLMDTRESRWLPTVMGKAAGKIVMNAALGFDTFVVMRHGLYNPQDPTQELGCYFCNDVVAPTDSMTDRTLDQQCTVTRPGIAAIASALLVEMLVSVIQHPQGALAPGSQSQNEDRGSHPLGIVPHQIRGYLSEFRNMLIKGSSYDCCSACSYNITSAYESEGWEFVKKALNSKAYVEELSGLAAVSLGYNDILGRAEAEFKQVQRAAEKALANIEWSDDGGIEDDEGDGEMI